jgi:hypothetical protein
MSGIIICRWFFALKERLSNWEIVEEWFYREGNCLSWGAENFGALLEPEMPLGYDVGD